MVIPRVYSIYSYEFLDILVENTNYFLQFVKINVILESHACKITALHYYTTG